MTQLTDFPGEVIYRGQDGYAEAAGTPFASGAPELIVRPVDAAGVAAAAFIDDPVMKMAAFTLSAMGLNASLPVFWTLAPNFLTGASAAVGIAFINSVAALAAFVAPWVSAAPGDRRRRSSSKQLSPAQTRD